MRILVCGLAAATLPLAAGAAPPRSVTFAAPVTALAFDGITAAASTGTEPRDCDRVRTWNVTTGATTRFGRRTHCESTSTGRGIASLSIARRRVLWLHYAGGNIREWSLWTATPTRPSPRRLRFVARDVDAAPPIVVGDGDGSRFGDLLPYALDSTVIALSSTGARRFSWAAPERVAALSALAGELAVAHGRDVTVLDLRGSKLRTERYASEVRVVKLTGSGILVQRGRTLELRGGGPARVWTLPGGAQLADTSADAALYLHRGRAVRLLFGSGRHELVRSARFAQLEGVRLLAAAGRRVVALSPDL